MEHYKISFKYGLYGALIGLVFYLLLLFSGNSPWGSESWMGSWIPGITAYFAIKTFKEDTQQDSFTFSQLFRLSFSTIFFQAMFVNILSLIAASILNTNAIETYKAEMTQNAEQLKTMISVDMYNQLQTELQNISQSVLAFWDFIYKLIGGLIVSLILARSLKSNKPIFDNQHE
ncbi:MAG: DUF4199 domain-containing protein [Bacteroidetes bacterium]|nr:DUF4199 domain-containing protein [Bacteroidota bacterium]